MLVRVQGGNDDGWMEYKIGMPADVSNMFIHAFPQKVPSLAVI